MKDLETMKEWFKEDFDYTDDELLDILNTEIELRQDNIDGGDWFFFDGMLIKEIIDLKIELMNELEGENEMKTVDITKRLRGFEFISGEQAEQDFKMSLDELEEKVLRKLPKRGTSKSAGYDIFAPYDIVLQPNEEIKIPTGLKAYMQDGEVLMAFPRSGLGFGYYCRLANTVGVIDSDYYNNSKNEGHMFVKLRNEGTKEMMIKQGEGMCQMIFMPFLLADDDSFDEGETRQGGFGSTTKGDK